MNESRYTVKSVEWTAPEADEARRIRLEVFVGEQGVPAELELDSTDPTAHHVIACDREGRVCGTARMFPAADDPGCARIGRMAVVRGARGTGCGSALLQALIEEARRQGYRRITLSAQTHAAPFYARHGFVAEGDVYEEAGIPHQKMEMDL